MRWAWTVVLSAVSFVAGGVVGILLERKHPARNTPHAPRPAPSSSSGLHRRGSFQRFYKACRSSFAQDPARQHKALQHFQEVFIEAGLELRDAFNMLDRDQDGN